MKIKLLNLALILTSLIAYLEWGGNHHMFLFEAAFEIVKKMTTDPISALHPLTVLPFVGQILLIINLFRKSPLETLTYIAIACISLLVLVIFLIGILNLNIKMIVSTLPFLAVSVWFIIENRKLKKSKSEV
jgi:hypothetical protein